MTKKTLSERVAEQERKVQQEAERLKQLKQRLSTTERKQRTRQLITMGGVLAAWGFNNHHQVEALLQKLRDTPAMKGYALQHLEVENGPKWSPAQPKAGEGEDAV